MKRRIAALIITLCMMLTMMPLHVHATETEHTHNWSAVWSANTESHWHDCLTNNCTATDNAQKDSYGAHDFSTYPNKCDTCAYVVSHTCTGGTATCKWKATCTLCGYNYGTTNSDNHQFPNGYGIKIDDSYHSIECSCGYVFVSSEEHNFGPWYDEDDGMQYRICGDCYHTQTRTVHTHSYDSCVYNRDGHWNVCSCGATTSVERHNWYISKETDSKHYWRCACGNNWNEAHYDGNGTEKCDACGYAMPHVHDWGSWEPWVKGRHKRVCQTDSTHWEEGSCSYKVTNVGYENHELTCSGCGDCLRMDHHFAAVDDEVHTYVCTVCEFKTGLEHLYNIYKYDGTSHWLVCDCGLDKPDTVEEHSFGEIKSSEEKHWSVCTVCEYATQAQSHTYSAATCTAPATCSCGATKGNKNPNNHTGGTEIRGVVTATHTEKGYTGDTYCLGCGAKIADGRITNPTGYVNVKYGDDAVVEEVTFIASEGVSIPADAELVIAPYEPQPWDIPLLSYDNNVIYVDEYKMVQINMDESVTVDIDGITHYVGSVVRINGDEFLILGINSPRLTLLSLTDKQQYTYYTSSSELEFDDTGTSTLVEKSQNKKIVIDGITYDVFAIYSRFVGSGEARDEVILYYDGQPAGVWIDNTLDVRDGYDPETLKQKEQLSMSVTIADGSIPGLNSGNYNVYTVAAQDISMQGTENVSGQLHWTVNVPTSISELEDVTYVAVHKSSDGFEYGIFDSDTAVFDVTDFSPFIIYAFVPADEPEIKTLSATVVEDKAATAVTHTVVSGETLTDIARMYGCTVDEIVALNSDLIENPSQISVGWVLTVPAE